MTEQHPLPQITGEAATLARRYAAALYDLAAEQGGLEVAEADLKSLLNGIQQSTELQNVLAHPRVGKAQMQNTLAALADQMKLGKITKNFIHVVVANGRASLLAAVSHTFLAFVAERRGEQVATVTTAQALTEAQAKTLTASLQQISGGTVTLDVRQDAALLGGLTVKLGAKLYDGSLKGQLARLMKHMQEAA